MKRETFTAILAALLGEADAPLLVEAKNLLWSRERTLKEERIREFRPGGWIEYRTAQGHAAWGRIDHLNKLSVTLERAIQKGATEGTIRRGEIVPSERIVSSVEESWLRERGLLS